MGEVHLLAERRSVELVGLLRSFLERDAEWSGRQFRISQEEVATIWRVWGQHVSRASFQQLFGAVVEQAWGLAVGRLEGGREEF